MLGSFVSHAGQRDQGRKRLREENPAEGHPALPRAVMNQRLVYVVCDHNVEARVENGS